MLLSSHALMSIAHRFTVYLIEVTPPWFYNVPSYTVHRRYREFFALYKEMVKVFGKGQVRASCVTCTLQSPACS